MGKKTPRGIRGNNPGNIRWGSPWQGLIPVSQRTDKDFCQFVSAAYGIRALAVTLITYQDKRRAPDGSVIDTVAEAIGRWAPESENDTKSYIAHVCAITGFAADQQLNFHDIRDLRPLVEAIIRHENGAGPLSTDNSWYDEATIMKGLEMAGIEVPKRVVAKVPVTKESVGASATGVVGVAQIAQAVPAIQAAVTSQQDQLTSGDVSKIIIGLVLVALAVFITLSQVRKSRNGTD